MYKVIKSWRHIDRRRFTEMFRWLLRAGHVGSIGTFNAYKGAVSVTGQTYYALVDKVRPSCQSKRRWVVPMPSLSHRVVL